MEIITTILSFLAMLSILVVFHEFGHYLAARWCGVMVLRFSVGMGPPVWKKTFAGGDTEWRLSWIPLGGYVMMLQNDMLKRPLPEKEKLLSFDEQPLWRRTIIVLAGPVFNLLLAVLFFALSMMAGMPSIKATAAAILPDSPIAESGILPGQEIVSIGGRKLDNGLLQINEFLLHHILRDDRQVSVDVLAPGGGDIVLQKTLSLSAVDVDAATRGNMLLQIGLVPQLAAQMAVLDGVDVDGQASAANLSDSSVGLRRGDRILAVNGEQCISWRCFTEKIASAGENPMQLTVLRDGSVLGATMLPKLLEDSEGNTRPMVGITPLAEDVEILKGLYSKVHVPPLAALSMGVDKTISFSVLSLRALWRIISGDVSTKALNGPVAIAHFSGQVVSLGLAMIFTFMAMISVGLGIFNLLPLPVLDGGYLVYFLLEWVRGRPLSVRAQHYTQMAGMAALAGVFILVTYNDIKLIFA